MLQHTNTLTSCANVVKHLSLTRKFNWTMDSCQAVSAHILAASFCQHIPGTFYWVKSLSRVPMPTLLKASVRMFLSASLQMLRRTPMQASSEASILEPSRACAQMLFGPTGWPVRFGRVSQGVCADVSGAFWWSLSGLPVRMVRELAQHLQYRPS